MRDIEKKYSDAGTLTAEFTQVNESAALGNKKKSSGKLLVRRPNKVRWETVKPDSSILVSNGVKFWFYTPPFDEEEPGQLIEKKSSEIQSKMANALLSGSFSNVKDMKVQQETPTRFVLIPLRGSAGSVERAIVEIDPEKSLIEKVVLEHEGGNRSEISLTGIELGKDLATETFEFTPPPNTERVE